jgi:hypothetical protein
MDHLLFFDGLKDCPVPGKARGASREGVDFLVLYISQRQRQIDQNMMDYFARQIPEFTARINGIDYAEVYNLHELRP